MLSDQTWSDEGLAAFIRPWEILKVTSFIHDKDGLFALEKKIAATQIYMDQYHLYWCPHRR